MPFAVRNTVVTSLECPVVNTSTFPPLLFLFFYCPIWFLNTNCQAYLKLFSSPDEKRQVRMQIPLEFMADRDRDKTIILVWKCHRAPCATSNLGENWRRMIKALFDPSVRKINSMCVCVCLFGLTWIQRYWNALNMCLVKGLRGSVCHSSQALLDGARNCLPSTSWGLILVSPLFSFCLVHHVSLSYLHS